MNICCRWNINPAYSQLHSSLALRCCWGALVSKVHHRQASYQKCSVLPLMELLLVDDLKLFNSALSAALLLFFLILWVGSLSTICCYPYVLLLCLTLSPAFRPEEGMDEYTSCRCDWVCTFSGVCPSKRSLTEILTGDWASSSRSFCCLKPSVASTASAFVGDMFSMSLTSALSLSRGRACLSFGFSYFFNYGLLESVFFCFLSLLLCPSYSRSASRSCLSFSYLSRFTRASFAISWMFLSSSCSSPILTSLRLRFSANRWSYLWGPFLWASYCRGLDSPAPFCFTIDELFCIEPAGDLTEAFLSMKQDS